MILQDLDVHGDNLDTFNRSTNFTTHSIFHDENMAFTNEGTENYPVTSNFDKSSSDFVTTVHQYESGLCSQRGKFENTRGNYNRYTVADKIWIAQSLERIGSKATNMILTQKYGKPLARSTLHLIRKQYSNMQKESENS